MPCFNTCYIEPISLKLIQCFIVYLYVNITSTFTVQCVIMSKCNQCLQPVVHDEEVLVCYDCKRIYHPACTKIRTMDKFKKMNNATKSSWRCDICTADSSSRSDMESGENKILQSISQMRNDINLKFNEVNSNMSEVKGQLTNVTSSINDLKMSLDTLAQENDARKIEYEQIVNENQQLKVSVSELKEQVADIQQYTRRNNIEIVGIPMISSRENVYTILSRVADVIDVPYGRQDISVAHRLPVPRSNRINSPQKSKEIVKKHPSIVVQFVSRNVKAEWMAAFRANREALTAAALNNSLEPTPVFLNDHLTGANKMILGRGRELVRQKKLAGAWTFEGKIWVRRTKEGPATRVKSVEEVDNVLAVN